MTLETFLYASNAFLPESPSSWFSSSTVLSLSRFAVDSMALFEELVGVAEAAVVSFRCQTVTGLKVKSAWRLEQKSMVPLLELLVQ